MLIHTFALRWKPEATKEQKSLALASINAFPEKIPGILALHAGTNVSAHSRGFETLGILHFSDKAALDAYRVHPVHKDFVASVQPFAEAVDLDLEI